VVYSPPFRGHRLINSGLNEFIVLTIGQADAGHDYELISERGMAKLVVERGTEVELITNPSYQA
jgi:glucose-6-phosphate isomerase